MKNPTTHPSPGTAPPSDRTSRKPFWQTRFFWPSHETSPLPVTPSDVEVPFRHCPSIREILESQQKPGTGNGLAFPFDHSYTNDNSILPDSC